MGPSTIRIAGLHERLAELGCKIVDMGDITVPVRETVAQKHVNLNFLDPILKTCESLAKRVKDSLSKAHLPVILGGDHSIAIGSVSGVSQFYHEQGNKVGLIWIDAHADMNTPQSSPSGNIHGMPLAVLLGYGADSLTQIGGYKGKVASENVALVGIRNLDQHEKQLVKECGIRYFTMREIDEKGMFRVMEEAIQIAMQDTVGIHLSLDLDGIDPLFAPGVSTPVMGGLTYREVHLALEMIADTKKLSAMEFVEINPRYDSQNKTALLAVELILSCLGKAIV